MHNKSGRPNLSFNMHMLIKRAIEFRIFHILGAISSCSILIKFILDTEFSLFYKVSLFFILTSLAVAFILTTISNKKFDCTVALIYLVALYFGLFAAIDVLKSKPSSINLPDLPKGTVGFRAINSNIYFTNIKIHYRDEKGNWAEIPAGAVTRKENWTLGLWSSDQSSSTFIEGKEEIYKGTYVHNGLRLYNCGAVFQYKTNHLQFQAKDIRLDADVYIINRDKEKQPSLQYCLRVPGSKKENITDLYLGFELFPERIQLSKVWIPAIGTQAKSLRQAPLELLRKHGGLDPIENYKKYSLTAISFDKFARFIGYDENRWSVTLCESHF